MSYLLSHVSTVCVFYLYSFSVLSPSSLCSYSKTGRFDNAVSLLVSGAMELIEAQQLGSGADLCSQLLKLYDQHSTPVSDRTAGIRDIYMI